MCVAISTCRETFIAAAIARGRRFTPKGDGVVSCETPGKGHHGSRFGVNRSSSSFGVSRSSAVGISCPCARVATRRFSYSGGESIVDPSLGLPRVMVEHVPPCIAAGLDARASSLKEVRSIAAVMPGSIDVVIHVLHARNSFSYS